MIPQFDWSFPILECINEQDGYQKIVSRVYWRLIARYDGIEKVAGGSVDIPFIKSEEYIPFEQITKDEVLNWIERFLTVEEIESYKTLLTTQILEQIQGPPPSNIIVLPPPFGE